MTDLAISLTSQTGSRGRLRRDVVVGGGDGVRREAGAAGGRGGGGRQCYARVQGRRHPRAHSHVGK